MMKPISIWQPRIEHGEPVFVRPVPSPLGDHYAARVRIAARKPRGTRRICWFGESAAAGYLYAPHLTPAGLLESMLTRSAGKGRFEVVDLARTNETLSGLIATARAAMQLAPDILAVYAGNNWNLLETPELSPHYPSAEGRQACAEALRDGGILGLVELAGRRRLAQAAGALEELAALARGAAIPLLIIVPEVNLADWESRQPVAWLPGDGSRQWHRLYRRAEAASVASDWQLLRRLAGEMLTLDEGSCPTTFRLLARALLAEGDTAAARRAAEAEVSCHQYPAICFLGAPQASVADQELIRRSADRLDLPLVDLPKLFARQAGTPCPGRRFFLDYCHLTAEGMAVAMAAVASRILGFEGLEAPFETLLEAALPAAGRDVEAVARLGAAVHTAHRELSVGGGLDHVTFWLEAALDASLAAVEMMIDLAEARTAPVPEILAPAQGRSLARPFPLGHQHGWRYDHLDLALLATMRRLLERRAPEHASRLVRACTRFHDVAAKRRELLWPPLYLWEPQARLHPEIVAFADIPGRATLRSPWPSTELGFVTSGECSVLIEIEARLPAIAGTPARRRGTLEVLLDGSPVGRIVLGCRWSRGKIHLRFDETAARINRLSLRWPELPAAGDEALDVAIRRLEGGLTADVHPVFGELFSVRVGPSDDA